MFPRYEYITHTLKLSGEILVGIGTSEKLLTGNTAEISETAELRT